MSELQSVVDPVEKARFALRTALADADGVVIPWLDDPDAAGGWSLAPDALRMVHSLVHRAKPQHILELGSGVSTRALAHATDQLSHVCCITSVDNDPAAIEGARAALAGERYRCELQFQLAPLVLRKFDGRLLPAYCLDPDRFASQKPPDLVLIDGPSQNLGGREGTFYQLFPLLRAGSIVLLDDANRASEASSLLRWRDNFGAAIEVELLQGFAKGLAVVIVAGGRAGARCSPDSPRSHGAALLSRQEGDPLKAKERQLTALRARLFRSLARESEQRTMRSDLEKSLAREAHAADELRNTVAELLARTAQLERAVERFGAAQEIRKSLSSLVSPTDRVFVVCKGDDEFLEMCGNYPGGHFPCDPRGRYTGHHPESSEEAIGNLRQLCQEGDLTLAFPSSAFWWLEHYDALARHLLATFKRIVVNDRCIIYQSYRWQW